MLFHGIDDVICKKSCDSFFRYYHWILGKKNLSHFKWCQNHCFCHPMWGNNWDLVIKGFVLFEMLRTIPLQKVSTHFCGFPVSWEICHKTLSDFQLSEKNPSQIIPTILWKIQFLAIFFISTRSTHKTKELYGIKIGGMLHIKKEV